ncbi:MAG: hypothetical protein P8008_07720 [Gammaproteobacteria bacterium]
MKRRSRTAMTTPGYSMSPCASRSTPTAGWTTGPFRRTASARKATRSFGAESDEELARLWFQGAPFALIGAHVLQRRLLAHGIVRALDEANGFVRRLNALAQQGAEPRTTGTGAHPESGAVH